MRYRHEPDRPDEPILEASAREVNAFRPFLRSYMRRRFPVGLEDPEDAVQMTIIVVHRIVEEGRIRGAYELEPQDVLFAWVIEVAWRIRMNVRRTARWRERVILIGEPEEALVEVPSRASALDERVHARLLLASIADRAAVRSLRALILVAEGATLEELAAELGAEAAEVVQRLRGALKR
ncbi:hypothetical protein [Polyangium spumosum]|uniref:Sigma-70 family RNA polymerase sigma factor n=1 Tax=Polyangium spumosum TaxID=889282 RepID=A0A6N7PVJ3_9BACT|nr:hypothetical protein [Polyangium spumosum]MRG94275.1 hypothetical protein [Polyangium spumosum]